MQILVCLHRCEASQSGYFVNRIYDFAGGNSFRPINFLQLLLIFFPGKKITLFSTDQFLTTVTFSIFFPCMGKNSLYFHHEDLFW